MRIVAEEIFLKLFADNVEMKLRLKFVEIEHVIHAIAVSANLYLFEIVCIVLEYRTIFRLVKL